MKNSLPKKAGYNFKIVIFTMVSSAMMLLFYQNFSPNEAMLELNGKLPSQVFSFYKALISKSPDAQNPTQYVLAYSSTIKLETGGSISIGSQYGVGGYNASKKKVEIVLNPAFENDPIGSGFVIAHELVHGVTGYNPDHVLSGSFSTGFSGAATESIDHVAAYEMSLSLWPDLIAEYVNAGDLVRAGLYAAAFDQARSHYENIKTEMNRTFAGLQNGLASGATGLSQAHVVNGVAVSGSLKLESQYLTGELLARGLGPYTLTLSVTQGGQVFSIVVYANQPLTSANIAQFVNLLLKKIDANIAILSQALTPAQIDKLKAELLSKLKPVSNSSAVKEVIAPTGVNGTRQINIEGVRVVDLNGISSKVGSVEVIQKDDQGSVEDFRRREYEYKEPEKGDGALGGLPSGCLKDCPKPN